MVLEKMYNWLFKETVDKHEKKEELEFKIKELLTYTHNYWRACGSISVDTIELEERLGVIWNSYKHDKELKIESNDNFYDRVSKYYDEIEKRKEQHKKDGFDWNHNPFEKWTKEDWENY